MKFGMHLTAHVMLQDIVYGFKSTQLFNVGDLVGDMSTCRASAELTGQHLLQQFRSGLAPDVSLWQTHKLTGDRQITFYSSISM